jgi:hypothetical protein
MDRTLRKRIERVVTFRLVDCLAYAVAPAAAY